MMKPMIFWSCGDTFEHLNSINLNHYIQACSNNRLCQTTNAESVQANSHPIVNANSNHFFDSQMKNSMSQTTTTKLYPPKQRKKKHKKQCIKNKRFSDYIYSNANL